ncbi:hypothetical protein H0H93_003231, partial [Arthromyces matolae]
MAHCFAANLGYRRSLSLRNFRSLIALFIEWQTKWDRSKLFTSLAPSTPINFGTPGAIGQADIVVDDSTVYQSIAGFGGSLTDSSAKLLNNLKSTNAGNYNTLLNYMFGSADGANAAGLNYIRVPIGASDFSDSAYSYDDTSGDTSFSSFNANRAPSYLFSVLQDIKAINSNIKVHLLPWSPNEPQNSNPTYPSATMSAAVEAQIAASLRTLLNNNGLSSVKIVGFEHNWDNAGSYPITL